MASRSGSCSGAALGAPGRGRPGSLPPGLLTGQRGCGKSTKHSGHCHGTFTHPGPILGQILGGQACLAVPYPQSPLEMVLPEFPNWPIKHPAPQNTSAQPRLGSHHQWAVSGDRPSSYEAFRNNLKKSQRSLPFLSAQPQSPVFQAQRRGADTAMPS